MTQRTRKPLGAEAPLDDHLTWVRTRMTIDQEFLESARHGFSLIVAGFGSFSIFEGLTIGEREGSELPRTFALIVTVVGVVVILAAIGHARKMAAWIDADEFGAEEAPQLPNENRQLYLGAAAAVIGAISFVALLLLP